ncbi:MAG: hypothetical protein GY720_23890 [bacterium]|nr:hypothetical protein [bacterium]
MHDKPQAPFDTPNQDRRPLNSMIAELEAGDPAAAPNIADEIAVRLEGLLAAASAASPLAEPVAEPLPFIEEVADTV